MFFMFYMMRGLEDAMFIRYVTLLWCERIIVSAYNAVPIVYVSLVSIRKSHSPYKRDSPLNEKLACYLIRYFF